MFHYIPGGKPWRAELTLAWAEEWKVVRFQKCSPLIVLRVLWPVPREADSLVPALAWCWANVQDNMNVLSLWCTWQAMWESMLDTPGPGHLTRVYILFLETWLLISLNKRVWAVCSVPAFAQRYPGAVSLPRSRLTFSWALWQLFSSLFHFPKLCKVL